MELRARPRRDALRVEPSVDRVGAGLACVQPLPARDEAAVVVAPAESAGTVPGGERRRLVEEEELREAPGLLQGPASPAAEAQSARDPALAVVAAANPARVVVEAAAVSVDQPTGGVCDQLAERRDPV